MGLKKLIRQWLDIDAAPPAIHEANAEHELEAMFPPPSPTSSVADALALISIGVGGDRPQPSIHERHTVAAKRKHKAEPVIVDPNDPAALLRSLQS
jgi:hypothetical protein